MTVAVPTLPSWIWWMLSCLVLGLKLKMLKDHLWQRNYWYILMTAIAWICHYSNQTRYRLGVLVILLDIRRYAILKIHNGTILAIFFRKRWHASIPETKFVVWLLRLKVKIYLWIHDWMYQFFYSLWNLYCSWYYLKS